MKEVVQLAVITERGEGGGGGGGGGKGKRRGR